MQAPVQLQQLSQAKAALEAAAQRRSLAADAAGEQPASAPAESQVSEAWEEGVRDSAAGQGGGYGWGLDALEGCSSWGKDLIGRGSEQGPSPAGEVSVSIVDWVSPRSAPPGEAWGVGSGPDLGPGEAWSPTGTPRTAAAWDPDRGAAACRDSGGGASGRPPEGAQGRLTGIAQAAVAAGHWPAVPSAPLNSAGAGHAGPAAPVVSPAGAAGGSPAAASDPFAGLLSASGPAGHSS